MDEACASKVGSKGSPSPTCSFCTVSLVFRLAYLCRKITKIKTREREKRRKKRAPPHCGFPCHEPLLYSLFWKKTKRQGWVGGA